MKSKHYFITGASSGIGLAVSDILLNNGHKVIGLSRSEPPVHSKNFFWIQHDLSKLNTKEIKTNLAHWKDVGFNGAFLNAGMYMQFDIEKWDNALISSHMEVNFFANARLCEILQPFLLINTPSSLIFNTSDQAIKYKKHGLAYGASKAALASLSRALSVEWATDDIYVTNIMPGGVDTNLYRATKTGMTEMEIRDSQKKYPIGRVAKVDEISRIVAFLLLENNPSINGSEIRMDGGLGCL